MIHDGYIHKKTKRKDRDSYPSQSKPTTVFAAYDERSDHTYKATDSSTLIAKQGDHAIDDKLSWSQMIRDKVCCKEPASGPRINHK